MQIMGLPRSSLQGEQGNSRTYKDYVFLSKSVRDKRLSAQNQRYDLIRLFQTRFTAVILGIPFQPCPQALFHSQESCEGTLTVVRFIFFRPFTIRFVLNFQPSVKCHVTLLITMILTAVKRVQRGRAKDDGYRSEIMNEVCFCAHGSYNLQKVLNFTGRLEVLEFGLGR